MANNGYSANITYSNLQIFRFEGLETELSNLNASIILNNKFIDKISPLSSNIKENIINLPLKGELRIILRNNSAKAEVLYSVCLNTEILPGEGYQWLPLCESSNETLLSLPDYVEEPRVLLFIKPSGPLPSVQEITENSDKESDVESEIMIETPEIIEEETEIMPEIKFSLQTYNDEKNNSSAIKIMELEQALQNETWKFQQEIYQLNQEYRNSMGHMSMELEIYQAKCKQYRSQIELLKKDIETTKKSLDEEQNTRISNEIILKENIQKNENLSQKELCLLALLEQRDRDNLLLRTENQKLIKRIEELEAHKLEKNNSCSGFENDLSLESDQFKTKSSFGDYEDIKKETGSLDEVLKDALARLNIKGSFKKQQQNVYLYGNKKVYMILKNGVL